MMKHLPLPVVVGIALTFVAVVVTRGYLFERSTPPKYPTREDILQARVSQLHVENGVLRKHIQDQFDQKRAELEDRTHARVREDASAIEALWMDLPANGMPPSHPGARPRRHPAITVAPPAKSSNLPPPPVDESLPKGSPFQPPVAEPKRGKPDV